jgi:FAD/FMN-containing dehydrogenase
MAPTERTPTKIDYRRAANRADEMITKMARSHSVVHKEERAHQRYKNRPVLIKLVKSVMQKFYLETDDGKPCVARANENEDLFWALRGEGGNFGVVTSFEFRAHPVSTVLGAWSCIQETVRRKSSDFIVILYGRHQRS